MLKIGRFVGLLILVCAFVQLATAHDRSEIHKRLAEVAQHVKQVKDPAAKRALLDDTFRQLTDVLNSASQGPLATAADQAALKLLARNVQEKRDELNGKNGFQLVDDSRLNNFADYSIQDLEQADQWVTISVTTLILIVLLVLLLRA
jgi:hypothetical protein